MQGFDILFGTIVTIVIIIVSSVFWQAFPPSPFYVEDMQLPDRGYRWRTQHMMR
jgi:hypothetical protein